MVRVYETIPDVEEETTQPKPTGESPFPVGKLTMVVLHGWGSSTALMQPIPSELGKTYRTLSIDLPGHGATQPPPSGWGVPEHVELVRQVLEQNQVTRFALIGHSNGGRISLELAASRSEPKPEFLVLLAPSGIKRPRTTSYYIRFWTAKLAKMPFVWLPNPLRDWCLDWLRHSYLWSFLGSSDYNALSGVMKETFVKTVNHYVEGRLSHIDCPVLVVWGTNDDSISKYQMDLLVAGLPNGGLYELKDAGHFGYRAHAPAVISAILNMAESNN